MANKVNAQLLGGKELERMFRTLGGRVQRKVARQAMSAALTPISNAAIEHAAEDSGALKLALKGGKKVTASDDKGVTVGLVGARKDVRTTVDGKVRRPSRYAHLVENGHIDAAGNHVSGQPFLRPAYDEHKDESLGIMADKFA